MSDNLSGLAKTFAGVLVVVFLVAGVATVVSPPAWSDATATYNTSTLDRVGDLATVPAANGTIDAGAGAGDKVVLFDMAHANAVDEGDVQPLVTALVEQGHEVRFVGATSSGPDGGLNQSLAQADAFVSIAPGQRFTGDEARGLADFAERGGRVLLMAEPTSSSAAPQVAGGAPAQPGGSGGTLTQVSARFDVAVGTGYLYNMGENANNYRHVYATPAGNGPLVEGVDRVVLEGAVPVTTARGVQPALTATEGTQLSSTREADEYAVAARNGDVAVVGDASVVQPGAVTRADNEVLVGNLVEHLVTGSKRPPAPGSDGSARRPGAPDSGPDLPPGQPTPPPERQTPPDEPTPTPANTPTPATTPTPAGTTTSGS